MVNNGRVLRIATHTLLAAHRGNTWLGIGATVSFAEASCGYVGVNDGLTELVRRSPLENWMDMKPPGVSSVLECGGCSGLSDYQCQIIGLFLWAKAANFIKDCFQ